MRHAADGTPEVQPHAGAPGRWVRERRLGAISTRPPWPVWYAPAALVILVPLALAAVIPVFILDTVIVALAGIELGAGELSTAAAVAAFAVQDAVAILTAVLFAGHRQALRLAQLGLYGVSWRRAGAWVAGGTGAALGFEMLYLDLVSAAGDRGAAGLGSSVDAFAPDHAPLSPLAVGVTICVLAPIAEEIFFRGFVYVALRSRLGVGAAAGLDALLFASVHYRGGDWWIALPVVAVLGLVLCLVYECVGSLYPLIAIHALFNAFYLAEESVPTALGFAAVMLAACALAPRVLPEARAPGRRGALGSVDRLRPAPA